MILFVQTAGGAREFALVEERGDGLAVLTPDTTSTAVPFGRLVALELEPGPSPRLIGTTDRESDYWICHTTNDSTLEVGYEEAFEGSPPPGSLRRHASFVIGDVTGIGLDPSRLVAGR